MKWATTRRQFAAGLGAAPFVLKGATRKPNVVVMITDDQGYGDLSLHGNPHLKTPAMDSIARDGVQFTQFQVSPVCSPTRSSLLTGRYNYRTGVVDTFLGRSMMHSDEVTLAEMLKGAGYRTGIFGKWHLGDNYPLRSVDQGFEESLVHRGGGMVQPGDPPGSTYFDPILQHNGSERKFNGYCTDVFADAAIRFLETNRSRPFFAYLATNAPHTPLQVEERWASPFRAAGLDDTTAKVYGMVANADENIGRVLAALKRLELERDTIVVFLTDNGPQQPRYNAGMRGRKGTVYQGGIRVPCFVRWPGRIQAGSKIDRIAAHIDMVPTLLDACGVPKPRDVKMDGRSLMPLLGGARAEWPERTLFTQWHRGEEPQAFRASAVRTQRWKLVDGKELYDVANDPAEQNDVAAANPEVVTTLRKEYEAWFKDVSATRGYAPPRIYLGTKYENPVMLTRQDWRGSNASWSAGGLGHWEVDARTAGAYEVRIRMAATPAAGRAVFRLNGTTTGADVPAGATQCTLANVQVKAGAGRLEAYLEVAGKPVGAEYVYVKKM